MQLKFLKLKEEHLEQVRLWRMKPEVSQFMYTSPDIFPEEQKQWYRKTSEDPYNKYWIIESNKKKVGLVSLNDIDLINRKTTWAYYIGKLSERGKGIGKQVELNILCYAFDKMNLNKVWGEVFAFNKKVIKLHEKCGSKIEGFLKEHICKNGKFYDVVTMGILKSDWKKIKGQFQIEEALIED